MNLSAIQIGTQWAINQSTPTFIKAVEIGTKQMYVEGISAILATIVFICTTYMIYLKFFKTQKDSNHSYRDKTFEGVMAILFSGCMSLIIYGVLLFILTRLLNPEYAILMKLMELIK